MLQRIVRAAKSCIFLQMISTALPVFVLGILGTLALAATGTAARARVTSVKIGTTTKIITKKTIS
ncbi:hypothetical protein PSUB009319_36020 [Ralstonia sp. SET104]|nr:hypothetical protein PSUB009319_36020 [Ralstonia sp. SET104]